MARTVRSSAVLLLLALAACGARQTPVAARPGASQRGIASWYGGRRFQGRRTASGERFDQNQLTAAHRTLPFGTRVRVTNLNNGRSVEVRINDRGPFGGRRVIDVSRAAARALQMIGDGTVPVRLEVLALPRGAPES